MGGVWGDGEGHRFTGCFDKRVCIGIVLRGASSCSLLMLRSIGLPYMPSIPYDLLGHPLIGLIGSPATPS